MCVADFILHFVHNYMNWTLVELCEVVIRFHSCLYIAPPLTTQVCVVGFLLSFDKYITLGNVGSVLVASVDDIIHFRGQTTPQVEVKKTRFDWNYSPQAGQPMKQSTLQPSFSGTQRSIVFVVKMYV